MSCLCYSAWLFVSSFISLNGFWCLIPLAIQFGTWAIDSWNDVGIFPFYSESSASSSASQYADCDASESNPSKRRFSPDLDHLHIVHSVSGRSHAALFRNHTHGDVFLSSLLDSRTEQRGSFSSEQLHGGSLPLAWPRSLPSTWVRFLASKYKWCKRGETKDRSSFWAMAETEMVLPSMGCSR